MKRQEPTNAAITMPPAAVTPDIIGQTGNAWPTALHAQSAGFITATAPVRHQPLIQPAKRFWVLWFMSTITVSAAR